MSKHQEVPVAVGGIAAKELMSIIDRIERLDQEIKGLNEDKRDIYQESKSRGYDVRAIKAIVAERRKMEANPEAYNETASMIELYRSALNMGGIQTDMFNTPSD